MSAFSKWIRDKYEAFRRERPGRAGSLSAFARQFGAPHQVVLAWFREGSNPPRESKYTARLIAMYGDEAYTAMGIPLPGGEGGLSDNEKKALALFRQVPDEVQVDVLDLIDLYLLRNGFRRVG